MTGFVTKSHLSVDTINSLFLFYQEITYLCLVTVTEVTKETERVLSLLSLSLDRITHIANFVVTQLTGVPSWS